LRGRASKRLTDPFFDYVIRKPLVGKDVGLWMVLAGNPLKKLP
jgi:hypothetical protein